MPLKSKYFLFFIIALLCICFNKPNSYAVTYSADVSINNSIQEHNQNFKKSMYDIAVKYENLNTQIAYDEIKNLIMEHKNVDFYLLLIAKKAAEIGLFDLSDIALGSIQDFDICHNHINDIKKYYYPKEQINKKDELILSELYSNITYNDQSKESIDELTKRPDLLKNYDYANYIMALGYYKVGNIDSAKKYISIAIQNNPTNINYLSLEAQIMVGEKKGKLSKKILKKISSQNIKSNIIQKDICITTEYVSYLTAKDNDTKDYYLGRYYFVQGDYHKAIRIIKTNSKNKKQNAKNLAIIARCYYELEDYQKAIETAKKSKNYSHSIPETWIALGDCECKHNNYKSALGYYKHIKDNEYRKIGLEKIADTYNKLGNYNKSNDIYKYLIKKYEDEAIAYYKIGLTSKENEITFLKKSLSNNLSYQDVWIDLARIALEKENFKLSKKYLTIANYLDDNNFRYYYYQSLLNKRQNELNKYIQNVK